MQQHLTQAALTEASLNQASNVNQAAAIPLKVVCRTIKETDLSEVAALLTRGFPSRSRPYWDHALGVMASRPVPPDCPRFGLVLENAKRLVGVVLLLFSDVPAGPHQTGGLRCFLSSWYVEDEWRIYANWLISRALRQKDTVYINMSPAPNTRDTIVAQGFTRFATGIYFSVPALARAMEPAAVLPFAEAGAVANDLTNLLARHARYGCMSVICRSGGRDYPFVFLRRRIPRTFLHCAQLVYCADFSQFERFAQPLGRYLLRKGLPVVMTGTNGPLEGIPGRFFGGRLPKYYRGAAEPGAGDLAYSEIVLFGP